VSSTPELTVRRTGGKIYSHVRKKWLVETPEERVRQEYLCVLVSEYGYSLEQIDEELSVTGPGSGDARADFLIWRTAQEKADGKTALIVVECKADNVTIDREVYKQGANYAQYERSKFFVTHNNRETKYWKVDLERRMPNFIEIENIPAADASDKEIEELIAKLKVFKEDEFANLLHQCHNVIRNREKKDPAAAFDEIAKILFIKVYFERRMREARERENLFTVEAIDQEKRLHEEPIQSLFDATKEGYKADRIFEDDATVNLKPATVREIVRLLERYNLSDTSEDIKGIAFERFLGRTFRGEIGQFFTPRTIVEFMTRMVEPKEGDIICDPASGSGGFLIRFFEIVRQQILADIDEEYQAYRMQLEAQEMDEAERARLLTEKYNTLQESVDQLREGSRLWRLANRCIYGCDANDRMARTSKMNMIMHGDGHGGVHHHDGFINVNGIFEGRFDIVLTNPPFGANVEDNDVILEYDVTVPPETERHYLAEYGIPYEVAVAKVKKNVDKPIVSLFDLPKSDKTKTEILFIERCLALLKPGGRLGIVLPEGIFNNTTLAYVREFVEDRAFIRAVVSLPQETFYSTGASVKASLLFLQKFTEDEQADYDAQKAQATAEVLASQQAERQQLEAILAERPKQSDFYPDGVTKPSPEQRGQAKAKLAARRQELKTEKKAAKKRSKQLDEELATQSRALLKARFPYPIFLYDAEKVGITATGEADANELYPNGNQPPEIEKTCLELYRMFRESPEAFFEEGAE